MKKKIKYLKKKEIPLTIVKAKFWYKCDGTNEL
jgi:uncharacterized protein YdaT